MRLIESQRQRKGMLMPIRVQRKRIANWRMPDNTIYVGRPTRWGNPYGVQKVRSIDGWKWVVSNPDGECRGRYTSRNNAQHRAVQLYQWMIEDELKINPAALVELRGKDLACWCRSDQPCHCDVLLELANTPADM